MFFSPPTLHPPLITTDQDSDLVRGRIANLAAGRPKRAAGRIAAGASFSIALTTVSKTGNFDSWIDVLFPTPGGNPVTASLMVDSGNSTMIMPNGEDLEGVPGYTILGTATEPWGCPANVVQGPLQIVATDGGTYQIDSCVFYACTANNARGKRTANFGMGCINPWSASRWNTPLRGVTLQSPLSYGTYYPYVEVVFEPATTLLSNTADVLVSGGSMLTLYTDAPSGYTLLATIPDLEWMSVVPASLAIGGTPTGWPGNASPIAMIDTGGGPVFLSDPNGYVYPKTWPDTVACPGWASTSLNCNCISDALQISLNAASGGGSYSYTIDTSILPPSVQNLTAVMCEVNTFMRNHQGMNVGGITALFNRILIDYAGAQVGLAPQAS